MSPIIGIPLNGVLLHPLAIWVELKCASYSAGFTADADGEAKDTPATPKETITLIAKFMQRRNKSISHCALINNHSPLVV